MIAGKALYFYNNIRKDSYNITCWCVSMKKCYNFILKASGKAADGFIQGGRGGRLKGRLQVNKYAYSRSGSDSDLLLILAPAPTNKALKSLETLPC